ncbi:hypothetical protein [Phreatobacter stygius]|uniref:Uncharacterized protein n=1 Tax=Phreatobacter stygius TaxID=1940610 RepID=A0A4D7BH72_9HYPH|nr:hypothetical protein [Phreatobacter stygius]QCI68496.1 hypothetical protein E8M01_32285 [Phreatobacter stygius]
MAEISLFEPLEVQPEDLGEFEKRFLLDVAAGVVRVVDAATIGKMKSYGLIVVLNRHVRLTERGHLFCRSYTVKRPAFADSTGKAVRTPR